MTPQMSTYDQAQPAESLFDLLGGRAAIAAVVERLYKHIMSDDELRPYFARSDLTRLKSQQVDFFTALTGGPAQYRGAPLKQAHAHVPISGVQFDRVAGHLATSMRELGVSQQLIDATLVALAPARRAVVNITDHAPEPQPSSGTLATRPSQAPAEARASESRLADSRSSEARPGHDSRALSEPRSAESRGSESRALASRPPLAVEVSTSEPTTPVDPLSDLRFLRAALDGVPCPVLIADRSLTVIYCNERALRAVEQQGDEFRHAIGAATSLVGASVAPFCGDATAAGQAFATTALPWEMRVTIGGTPVQVRTNGVFGQQNALLGYVVQWEPVAEQTDEEEEHMEDPDQHEHLGAAPPPPRIGSSAGAAPVDHAGTPTIETSADGTHVTLTVNGSTMTLVLSDGELSVQFVAPSKDGTATRAVGLRIGPPA